MDQNNKNEKTLVNSHPTSLGSNQDSLMTKKMRSLKTANLTLCFFLISNLVNYMDRYTVAGVLEDIRLTFKTSHSTMGFQQTMFIIVYMCSSPIFGYLGDRYSRKRLLTSGIVCWCIMNFMSSFVSKNNFNYFIILRGLMGIGQASFSTVAPTILADLFSNKTRTKALSIFYFAIPVGSGLGYIIGAQLAYFMDNWRYALRITPFIGIMVSLLIILFSTEPPRGASDGNKFDYGNDFSLIEDLKYLFFHKSFLLSSTGLTAVSFVTGALSFWAPYFIFKGQLIYYPTTMKTISISFGILTCLAGIFGVFGGFILSSKLRNSIPSIDPLICGYGVLGSTPFLFVTLVVTKDFLWLCWLSIFLSITLISLNWALATDILFYTVIPHRRSTAGSLQIFISHVLGDAGSPYIIGLMSDFFNNYEDLDDISTFRSLQNSLYINCFISVIGGFLFLINSIFVVQDKKNADIFLRKMIINRSQNNKMFFNFLKEEKIEKVKKGEKHFEKIAGKNYINGKGKREGNIEEEVEKQKETIIIKKKYISTLPFSTSPTLPTFPITIAT